MARYNGYGSAAVGTNKAIINLISAATIRPKVYDVIIGCGATPADLATTFVLQRTTAVGTEGSGFTPVAIDPGEPSAASDCGIGAFSSEPTKTANAVLLGAISMNQRATFRWVAAPRAELVAPATANNGICCQSTASGGTTAHEVSMSWEE